MHPPRGVGGGCGQDLGVVVERRRRTHVVPLELLLLLLLGRFLACSPPMVVLKREL